MRSIWCFPLILLGLFLVAESDKPAHSRTHKVKLRKMKSPLKWNLREVKKPENRTHAVHKLAGKGRLMTAIRMKNDDPPHPAGKISQIRGKLSDFKDTATAKIGPILNKFDAVSDWNKMSTADRVTVSAALNAVAGNLDKLANAKDNPIGAIQGTINIIGGFAAMAGPHGQIASIVLGFVSSFLGLFGNSREEKSMAQIVREQIDDALEAFRDELLFDKAAGVVKEFQMSKVFLDSIAQSDDGEGDLSDDITTIYCSIPVLRNVDFMGTLENRIRAVFDATVPRDAARCIKYIELYAKIAALKDLLVGQLAALVPDSKRRLRNAVLAVQTSLREESKALVEFLYSSDPDQKVLPYYDADLSLVTDAYAIKVLGISDYDRSLKGLRSLSHHVVQMDYIDWGTGNIIQDVPSATSRAVARHTSTFTRIWYLRPHGNNLFSIVNKRGCSDDPPSQWCDAFLSWEELDGTVLVTLSKEKPVMWQLEEISSSWRVIRNKWGCISRDSRCDMGLRFTEMNVIVGIVGEINSREITERRRFASLATIFDQDWSDFSWTVS